MGGDICTVNRQIAAIRVIKNRDGAAWPQYARRIADVPLGNFGRDRDNAALNQLEAFIHQVQALKRTGRLDPATADALIAAAQTIIGSI